MEQVMSDQAACEAVVAHLIEMGGEAAATTASATRAASVSNGIRREGGEEAVEAGIAADDGLEAEEEGEAYVAEEGDDDSALGGDEDGAKGGLEEVAEARATQEDATGTEGEDLSAMYAQVGQA